jgi:hypothetical protein
VPGPIIGVDNQHNNFHTIDDKYMGFERLLTADGYFVDHFAEPFVPGCVDDLGNCAYFQRLLELDTFVIANAQAPISAEEAEVITGWVSGELDGCVACSRSLMIIADHQTNGFDFPLQIVELSTRLGLDWPNNNVTKKVFTPDPPNTPDSAGQLNVDHTIVKGISPAEEVVSVTTFLGSGFIEQPGLRGESLLTLLEGAIWTDAQGTEFPGGGYSQGIAFRFGKGWVYASGEAAMFTAQLTGAGAKFGMQTLPFNENQQYLLNINHWIDGVMDEDSDGMPDTYDNCSDVANGLDDPPKQRDPDTDGYGVVCDADYDNDGDVDETDFNALDAAFGTAVGDPGYDPNIDHNGDGGIGMPDFGVFNQQAAQGYPGPSGLPCAGTIPCTPPPVCGDEILVPLEECDGADLGGLTCADFGCAGGTPSCSGTCEIDTSSCTGCPGCDNDGVCEPGEDCSICPNDCIAGGEVPSCGNGVCEAGDEDCQSCPEDCNGQKGGAPSRRFCCGSDTDRSGEVTCADPRCTESGYSCTTGPVSFCCGDLLCEEFEDSLNCGLDCGPPVGGVCGDLVCDPGEDCASCPDDCEGKTNGPDSKQFCCGNGVPEGPEGDGSRCQGNF